MLVLLSSVLKKKCSEGEQKYVCRLSDKCKAVYTAKSSAIRHLKTNHSKTYNAIKKRKIKKDNSDSTNELELRVKVNVSNIWVAFKSLPLNVLEVDAFQKLLRPYKIALESKGIVLSVTAESMKKILLENFDSDVEMDEDIFDEKYYDDLLNAIQKEFEIVLNSSHFVHDIRCSSHCLHLVITHAIKKSPQIQSFLDKVRTLLKKLRTPKYRNLLKSQGLNIPTLDVIHCFSSLFQIQLIHFSDYYRFLS